MPTTSAVQKGSIAQEAAELMGVEPARVLKTLMAVVDERTLVVTLVPGRSRDEPEGAGDRSWAASVPR